MAGYRLHCIGASGNSYKIALYLTCANLEWEPVGFDFTGGMMRDDGWRAETNAMGEIPVLEADGISLSQSGAILTWLADTTGHFAVPDELRFEAQRWMYFDNHKFTNNFAMHRFQRVLTAEPVHPAVLEFLRNRLEASCAIVDKHLETRRFVVGDAPSYVDFSMVGYYFYPTAETGVDLAVEYPHIDAWRQRIAALPGWKPPYEMISVGSQLPVRTV